MSIFNYRRRPAKEVKIGKLFIGGANKIPVQSMTNTSTLDTEGSVAQILRIAQAGGDIVRLTTQGEKEASNMEAISRLTRKAGCEVPLVADVHFNPKAAFRAALFCEKVRINPGNFADIPRTFRKLEFTDEEYASEIEKIRSKFVPFINVCKENGTTIRLGVNHGSLSDRIMSRYGDTPEGMVESVMEFLRICKEEDFHNVAISIKASNTVVMTRTVRLLCKAMDAENMNYPLHLGVTEAGDGEDGRIKSAIGIGTLLAEGYGDTIRVSLSEDPENEIPVAMTLRDHILSREGHDPIPEPASLFSFPIRDAAKKSRGFEGISYPLAAEADFNPHETEAHRIDAETSPQAISDSLPVILSTSHINAPGAIASWIERFYALGQRNPVIVHLQYDDFSKEDIEVKAAADFGTLLLNGYANGIWLDAPKISKEERESISLGILQGSRLRFSRTEYIACPSCGRTLFDLQKTLAEVKKATAGLKGLKIGVMGCIVNGPGEMADADYGYVGAGPGRVSLYKGKELVIKNIPTEEALPALMRLIKDGCDE